jgi:O-antigen/teichoic acid export membrane protein
VSQAGASGPPGEAHGATARSQHLRGSTALLLGRLGSLVITTTTQVVIVRALTKTEFGAFAFAIAIAAASRFLLSLGQGRTLSGSVSIFLERAEYGRLLGSVVLVCGTVLVTTAVLFGALVVFRGVLVEPLVHGPEAVRVLFVLVLLAPLEALDQVFVSLFAVLTRPRAILLRKYVVTPSLRLVVVLVLVGTDASVTFLAVGYVATHVLGICLYAWMLVPVLRERDLLHRLRLRDVEWPFRQALGFALPTLSSDLTTIAMTAGSVVLLSRSFGPDEVAEYRAVLPAAMLNRVVYTTFQTLYLPMVSRSYARGDHQGIRDDYWRTAVFLAVMTFPVVAMTCAFAPSTTVFLFDTRYASSSGVLAVLSLGYYLNSALGFNMITLQLYGRLRFLLLVNLGTALLNIACSVALIPRHGALGAALSGCITLAAQNVACQVGLRRVLGVALVSRTSLPAYASIAVGAAALSAAHVLWSPGILTALALTGVAFLVLLAVNRHRLQLSSYFPEVRRLPLVGRHV